MWGGGGGATSILRRRNTINRGLREKVFVVQAFLSSEVGSLSATPSLPPRPTSTPSLSPFQRGSWGGWFCSTRFSLQFRRTSFSLSADTLPPVLTFGQESVAYGTAYS